MVYPANFESKIGFDFIRDRVARYCSSGASQRLAEEMHFITDFEWVNTELTLVTEFKQLTERSLDFPSNHFYDPQEWLNRAAIEGNFLEPAELHQFSLLLHTLHLSVSFLQKNAGDFPGLAGLTTQVQSQEKIRKSIADKIDDTGHVKDTASPELQRIRKKLRDEQHAVRKLAEQFFKLAVAEKWTPDGALPTIRDGRVVIPLLVEHKRKVKGFVLDESATGQTVFLEPAEMLDANNAIRELEHAERREIIRIIKELTDLIREHAEELTIAFHFLARIDFIRAKTKIAIELKACKSFLQSTPALMWHDARHPILVYTFQNKKSVIPLTLSLTEKEGMLLVSGPNAGGKSVCLKTVGLLQYMLQCGMLVPMADHSRTGIFQAILLDIGDQQSIENDLSTYSSHLKNMKFFLQEANAATLVLMDELGSGTDPNFGGAIAEVILAQLLTKKVWGIATTHYYNLKLFAANAVGIRNGAMRFDEKELRPLYQLEIGKPGSSFALEIARNIGLPNVILAQAEAVVGSELTGFEKLARELEAEKQAQESKANALKSKEEQIKILQQRYQTLTDEVSEKKKQILQKAKEEAMQLLQTTNKEIEKTIRHIKENKAEKKETIKVRKSLQELSKKVNTNTLPKPEKKISWQEGDRVRLMGQHGSGVILELKGKNALVQFGELKTSVALTKLEKTDGPQQKELASKLKQSGINLYEKQSRFSPVLDLRGKRGDEAVQLLEVFIDDAILVSAGQLKILHGKGEGILRKLVRDKLKTYKAIASYADEHIERGGDGERWLF
ncbi:MAG: endonuclease MutS2 [Chryseotalea sp.]|jgi:DNA mismatch repair protein MutS2